MEGAASSSVIAVATVRLYCHCRQQYDPTRFMLACDLCDEWFHGACLSPPVLESDAAAISHFACDACRTSARERWNFALASAGGRALELRAFVRGLRATRTTAPPSAKSAHDAEAEAIRLAELRRACGVCQRQQFEVAACLDELLALPGEAAAEPSCKDEATPVQRGPAAPANPPDETTLRPQKRARHSLGLGGEAADVECADAGGPARWQALSESMWADSELPRKHGGKAAVQHFARLLAAERCPCALESNLVAEWQPMGAEDAERQPITVAKDEAEDARGFGFAQLRAGLFTRPRLLRAAHARARETAAPGALGAAPTSAVLRHVPALGLALPTRAFGRALGAEQIRRLLDDGAAERELDLLDVGTQRTTRTPMREWVAHARTPSAQRSRLLNLISLECSGTPLGALVTPPAFVADADWRSAAWPAAPATLAALAPRVAKYCLYGCAGSWTDFHLDLGGTSVWYHVVRGVKRFYLAPPSARNVRAYEAWAGSEQAALTFFGRLAEGCALLELREGDTLLIPAGWIHAVHTPVDSLVFGGNFLHTAAASLQLAVRALELRTRVDARAQYPHFVAIHWFAALHYARRLGLPAASAAGAVALRTTRELEHARAGVAADGDDAARALSECERRGVLAVVRFLDTTLGVGGAAVDCGRRDGVDAPALLGGRAACEQLLRELCTAVGIPAVDLRAATRPGSPR